MRGLPGCGKSTWIEEELPKDEFGGNGNAVVCSTNFYHTIDGVYQYDPKRAGWAHNQCLLKYLATLQEKLVTTEYLVVDSTNTTLLELSPYVRLAEAFGVEYEIVCLPCDLEIAASAGIHSVPINTLLRMQQHLLTELVPAHWKQVVVFPRR